MKDFSEFEKSISAEELAKIEAEAYQEIVTMYPDDMPFTELYTKVSGIVTVKLLGRYHAWAETEKEP